MGGGTVVSLDGVDRGGALLTTSDSVRNDPVDEPLPQADVGAGAGVVVVGGADCKAANVTPPI